MVLHNAVKAYREKHAISLRDLAKITGVSLSALHRFEHGQEIESTAWVKIVRWLLADEHRTFTKKP